MVDGTIINHADLLWRDSTGRSNLLNCFQCVASCKDQFGFGKANDMVQFLLLAARVRAHVHASGADDAEEEGRV
jgi:hypothetical protein